VSQSFETNTSQALDPAERVWRLITSNWMSQAIYVAAELRIADLLASSPKTSEELAGATGAHPPSLRRLLRALTTIEICREREDGAFELTPVGSILRSDSPESLRSWALYSGGYQWPIWGHLLDSVKTGESARKIVTGNKLFEHLERDPAVAAIFNQAMVELTRLFSQGVVRSYDFSHMKRIVDIGGGYGELLATILQANPGTHGVLFDLPHAIEDGRRHMVEVGLAERCEIIAGSFFETIPGQGDAYILSRIIHDWNDEQCKIILENCRRAIIDDGTLLLVERVVPERLEASADHQAIVRSDLNMLIGPGGCERTEAEFRALLSSTGFRLEKVIAIELGFNLIEAKPA
jgi:orsellinic acid C2-O-methyltransferase